LNVHVVLSWIALSASVTPAVQAVNGLDESLALAPTIVDWLSAPSSGPNSVQNESLCGNKTVSWAEQER